MYMCVYVHVYARVHCVRGYTLCVVCVICVCVCGCGCGCGYVWYGHVDISELTQ